MYECLKFYKINIQFILYVYKNKEYKKIRLHK